MRREGMLAPLLLAAALTAAQPAPAGPSPYRRIEQGIVIQVSPRPAAGSGVFAIYADFEVATPAGERLRMYVLWMGGSQYLPDVGAICAISYRHEPLARGNLHNPPARLGRPEGPLNVVYELSCGPPLALPSATLESTSARARDGGTFRAEDLLVARGPVVLERAFVIAASPRVNVLTSMIEFTTDFEVIAGGARYTLTMHDDPYEYFPPVGAMCTITYYPPALPYGANSGGPNRVSEAVCDSGRFPDPHPGFIEHARIARISPLPVRNGRQPRYISVEAEMPGRGVPMLYLSLAEGAPPIPAPGAECRIAYRYVTLHGRDIGVPPRDTHWLPVVDRLECGSGAAAAASQESSAQVVTGLVVEHARVVRVSPRPTFGSGVFAVFADFDVAAPDGSTWRMYQLWKGVPQEFLPVPGDICRIAYRRQAYSGVSSDHAMEGGRVVNLVDTLDCPSMLPAQRSPIAS